MKYIYMNLNNYEYNILMMGFAGSTAGEWLAGVSLTVVNRCKCSY